MKFNSGLNKFTLLRNVHSGKQDVVIRYKHIPKINLTDMSQHIVLGYI